MREQYATSLTSKNDEIKQYKTQCEALQAKLEASKRDNDALRRELDAAKGALSREMSKRKDAVVKESVQAPRQVAASQSTQAPQSQQAAQKQQASPRPASPKGGGLPPVVYLGYVNQRGLFVKASRTINPESSVYYMDIPDGHNGVYRVANEPEILDRLLSDPKLWLEGGCDIDNPEDADIATEIVILQTGEAHFSDNTCRVVKKARIKFI